MSPFIPKDKWRKGSQWISLVRSHAEVVINDEIIFPVFKKLCKMSELEGALERRTLTYTLWNQAATKIENNWHPVTFSYEDADPKWINEIKVITSHP
ncbi:hypothetical protein SLEP1_g54126 [Rubroshorea leprosula]|uniref:Uncharacterized protein n=1 Tax=Rubroshorea leprosula TaxID=152421 RepID=A0AAV5MBV2_9ROSI|nr:hypothetical protein SLEP1_g54126 [Rubroshorea leprosula]